MIYDKSLEDALQYASKSDWTGIVPDIGVPHFSPEKISQKSRKKLHELSESLGIEWGFHAPGDDISLYTTYSPIRSAIMSYFKEVIDLARDLSNTMTNVVIHPGRPPSFRKAGDTEDAYVNENFSIYETTLFENLLELIEYARPNVNIALENNGWSPLIRHSIPSLIARGMRLCLDIPKLYDTSLKLKKDDWRLFQQFSETIEVVHIHDYIPELGSHQLLGSGKIDFSESLNLFSRMEHPPQYVFEVRPREAATESLIRLDRVLSTLNLTLL
ncbi:MAG: TIM barrel protein [Candidatus Thorarchaeota archaeon]